MAIRCSVEVVRKGWTRHIKKCEVCNLKIMYYNWVRHLMTKTHLKLVKDFQSN
jgi:hypothetical protein